MKRILILILFFAMALLMLSCDDGLTDNGNNGNGNGNGNNGNGSYFPAIVFVASISGIAINDIPDFPHFRVYIRNETSLLYAFIDTTFRFEERDNTWEAPFFYSALQNHEVADVSDDSGNILLRFGVSISSDGVTWSGITWGNRSHLL
ncbi:MAG: hypothetical protein FWC97_10410 [Treponema sp.]|nr:hypothetical protein [Treponema sp.]